MYASMYADYMKWTGRELHSISSNYSQILVRCRIIWGCRKGNSLTLTLPSMSDGNLGHLHCL